MKKFIALIISAVLLLGLVSCGSGELSRREKLNLLIDAGKFNYPDSLKFVDPANDVICYLTIEGTEAVDEWYDNVIMKMSTEELLATPSMYKAVEYFGTEKQEFYDYNAALLAADPGSKNTVPDYVIEALYTDRDEMLRRLANVTSLYYDGAVYSFDEVTAMTDVLPADVLSAFADEVEPILRKIYGDGQYDELYAARVEKMR